jgi:hypothetical protein
MAIWLIQGGGHMKNPRSWLRTVILVACIFLVTSCTVTVTQSSCSSSNSYTLIWHPGVPGFSDVNLTLTPVIPPKALSLKPSDYVQVNLNVGNFSFSTNDPAYQCLETVAATTLPIIFAPQNEVISGFAAINDFLIVYHACGQFVQTSHASVASREGIAAKELIFFQITGQKMVSHASNGKELTPFGPAGGPISPTVPPAPPVLSVSPGNFSTGVHCSSNGLNSWVCLEELTNTGGGTLNWTASNSDDAQIIPLSGTLSAGQSTTLSINFACKSANFTMTFSGSTNTVIALVQVTNVESCH